MKNLLLFFVLILIIVSCAPHKYGRYFSNRPYQTTSDEFLLYDTTQQIELMASASATQMTTLDLPLDTKVDDQNITPTWSDVNDIDWSNKNVIMNSNQRDSTTVLSNSHQSINERKTEPLGVIALAMMLLVPFVATNIIAPVLIVGGLTLAILSLVKIKRNKVLWKGKGFGIATIVLLAIYLLFLGLLIYALSSAF